jgi:hypothetical protein
MRRSPKKSMIPVAATKIDTIRPTLSSQAEMLAHCIAAVCQYTRSLMKVPIKQVMGIGTSIA